MKLLILLVFVMFILACAEEAPEAPPAPEPELVPEPAPELVPEPAPEPEVVEAPEAEPESESILSRIDAEHGRMIQSLTCDATENIFKVTITNPTDKTFSLKRLSALSADAAGLELFTTTVNGRVIYNMNEICDSDTFEPGQTVTCEQGFTPNVIKGRFMIRTGNNDLGKKLINYMLIKTTHGNHEVNFICI